MDFKPLADNVLVKVATSDETTDTGIILPGSAQQKKNYGVAVAIGSGTLVKDGTKFPIDVEVGDAVLFRDDAGVKVNLDGEEYLVVREYDILGIIND